jgi:hypothetical protein
MIRPQKRSWWRGLAVVSGILIWSLSTLAQSDKQSSASIVSQGITIIGDEGRKLSSQDITSIEQALPDGAKPWLLSGDEPYQRAEIFRAYLPPTTVLPSLRKGVMIAVCCRRTNRLRKWTTTTGSYVQVAVEGRAFDDIQGDDDPNRPFSVRGKIDDVELIGLVEALRANPAANGTDRSKTLPILEVFRRSDMKDSVNVYLREGPAQAPEPMPERVVILRPEGPTWVVVNSGRMVPTKID